MKSEDIEIYKDYAQKLYDEGYGQAAVYVLETVLNMIRKEYENGDT